MVWTSWLGTLFYVCLFCCVVGFEAYRFAEMLFWWGSWEAERWLVGNGKTVLGLDKHIQGRKLKRRRGLNPSKIKETAYPVLFEDP